MKKYFVTILVLFLALVLVACGDDKQTSDISDVTAAKKIYTDTISEYTSATGVDAKFTYKDSKDNTKDETIVFQYNLDGDKIEELAYVAKTSSGELSVYVKDGVAYMNAYGTKSKVTMTDDDYATFKEKYKFANALTAVNSLFGYTFFSAANLDSAADGVCKLSCNLDALEADPSLDEDTYFEMTENIEKLQAKKALSVEYNYANGKMTKFVGTVTEQDDSSKVFTIEFNGTTAAITFPDLTGYEEK